MRLSKEHYHSIWKPLEGQKSIKIELHDTDPLHQPIIEPHFLADEDEIDYHTLLAGIHKAIAFAHTEALGKLGIAINHHPIYGCEDTEFGSDHYWKCAIKYLVVPTEDVSGTARMGPATDSEAVVDNKLKVYGVHRLRVADASIIPVSIT
ncbi:GMC oxred C domain containing protein, partial [Asbolus verrucosus]